MVAFSGKKPWQAWTKARLAGVSMLEKYGATTTCPSATSLSIFATSASLVVRLAIGGRLPSP